jgi:hypothetical protein
MFSRRTSWHLIASVLAFLILAISAVANDNFEPSTSNRPDGTHLPFNSMPQPGTQYEDPTESMASYLAELSYLNGFATMDQKDAFEDRVNSILGEPSAAERTIHKIKKRNNKWRGIRTYSLAQERMQKLIADGPAFTERIRRATRASERPVPETSIPGTSEPDRPGSEGSAPGRPTSSQHDDLDPERPQSSSSDDRRQPSSMKNIRDRFTKGLHRFQDMFGRKERKTGARHPSQESVDSDSHTTSDEDADVEPSSSFRPRSVFDRVFQSFKRSSSKRNSQDGSDPARKSRSWTFWRKKKADGDNLNSHGPSSDSQETSRSRDESGQSSRTAYWKKKSFWRKLLPKMRYGRSWSQKSARSSYHSDEDADNAYSDEDEDQYVDTQENFFRFEFPTAETVWYQSQAAFLLKCEDDVNCLNMQPISDEFDVVAYIISEEGETEFQRWTLNWDYIRSGRLYILTDIEETVPSSMIRLRVFWASGDHTLPFITSPVFRYFQSMSFEGFDESINQISH